MRVEVKPPDASAPGEWRVWLVSEPDGASIPIGAGQNKTKALAAAGKWFAALAHELKMMRVRDRDLTVTPPPTLASIQADLDAARARRAGEAPAAPEA